MYRTIDDLLSNEGFDSVCRDCEYAMQDEAVNFRGCEAGRDYLCPRLDLENVDES